MIKGIKKNKKNKKLLENKEQIEQQQAAYIKLKSCLKTMYEDIVEGK